MYNIVLWPLESCARSVHAMPGFMSPEPNQKMLIYGVGKSGKVGEIEFQLCLWSLNLGTLPKFYDGFP